VTADASYHVKRWPGFDGAAVSPVPQGPLLFERVRETIARHVRFSVEWALDLATLWVLQAYIAPSLPSVFYLFFSASKGKAKTTALDLLCALTGGLNASDVSVAALVHWLDENPGRAVCIDEMDVRRDPDRDSALAAICRNGNTPDKPYQRWDPTARRLDRCPTYGAKALGFRSKVDDALEDRGFTLPTAEVRGRAGAELVRQNLARDVGDLPVLLKRWAAGLNTGPSDFRIGVVINEEMKRDTWFQKVEDVVGTENFGANRETQLTMVALAVCRAACIDLTSSLQAAFGLRREVAAANTDEELGEAREVVEEILGSTGTLTKDAQFCSIRQSEFRDRLNARRKERGLSRPLTPSQVASLRNDLGVKATWLSHPKNKTTWNIPVGELPAVLGRGVPIPPNQPNPVPLDGGVSRVSEVRLPLPKRDSSEAQPSVDEIRQRLRWLESRGYKDGDHEIETLRKLLSGSDQ
jgi:hypothetical protein